MLRGRIAALAMLLAAVVLIKVASGDNSPVPSAQPQTKWEYSYLTVRHESVGKDSWFFFGSGANFQADFDSTVAGDANAPLYGFVKQISGGKVSGGSEMDMLDAIGCSGWELVLKERYAGPAQVQCESWIFKRPK